MGLFSSAPKIVDPYNTMGTPQGSARPAKHYTASMADIPAETVARRYGLTLAAAPRFAELYDEAEARTFGPRSGRAQEALDGFLADKKNRKRW